MCDFNPSQALEGSAELDETKIESCCSDMADEIFSLDEGLNMVVSRNPKTMQCVANLVIAVNRTKKSLTCCRELSDEMLCSVIMASLVDEKIVKTEENSTTGVKKKIFQRINSEKQFTLCDTSQKDLCQVSGELKLQAVTLKGGNYEHKVNFKLARYITPCKPGVKGQTVVLSIMNNNLHISSSMKDGKAVLNLEKCSERDLEEISDDGDMDRFLFDKSTRGRSLTTFESVKCPGWFISTSSEDECQSVDMCQVDTPQRLTYFKIN